MKPVSYGRLRLLPAIIVAFISATTVMVQSCNDIGCTDLRSSIPLAGFYSSSSSADKTISVDSLLIGGIGAPDDSLLVDTPSVTSSLYLPFRSQKPSTSFFIKYVRKAHDYPQFIDTVTFSYTTQPYFASADCGAMFIYRINSIDYTRHLIDSIAITDSLVNNFDMERIKIFFRTTENDDNDTPQQ